MTKKQRLDQEKVMSELREGSVFFRPVSEKREEEEKFPSSSQDIQQSREEDILIAGKQEEEKRERRTTYRKVNYRINPETLEHLEDIKTMLRRQFGMRVLTEEIVEEAIEAAYRDLTTEGETSSLVSTFSQSEKKKTKTQSARKTP